MNTHVIGNFQALEATAVAHGFWIQVWVWVGVGGELVLVNVCLYRKTDMHKTCTSTLFLQELLRPLAYSSFPHLSDHISAHANVRMAFGRPLQLPTVYSHHTSSKFALLTWLAGNFICFGKLFTLMLRALIISRSYYYLHRHWGKVGLLVAMPWMSLDLQVLS